MKQEKESSIVRDKFPVIVHALLIANEEVFLLLRQHTGSMDGWYCPPGGHMEHGETVQEAARRECIEETGIEMNSMVLRDVYSYQFQQEQGLNFVFLSDDWIGTATNGEPHVFDHGRFFPLDEIPAKTLGWVRGSISSFRSGREGVSLIDNLHN